MKRIPIVLLFFLIAVPLFACTDNPFNATVYGDKKDWIKEDFKKANLIRNVYYDDGSDELAFSEDESLPLSNFFIINDENKYNEIFDYNGEELQIDLTTQTVIVYSFQSIYVRELLLDGIALDDSILKVNLKMPSSRGRGDATMPYQRWVIVTLDKTDAKSVEFSIKVK